MVATSAATNLHRVRALHQLAIFALAIAAVGPLAAITSTGPAAAAQVVAQEGPAEEFEPEEEEEEEDPWTARYLAPTVAAMAGVVLVLVVVGYGVRVRGRYRVER